MMLFSNTQMIKAWHLERGMKSMERLVVCRMNLQVLVTVTNIITISGECRVKSIMSYDGRRRISEVSEKEKNI